MKYKFVTSMSLEGYNEYGKTFLETFEQYCAIPLEVYSEDVLPIEMINLYDFVPLFEEFMENAPSSQDYRFNAAKFACKVFALTNPRNRKNTDWLIWIDADVVVFDWITPSLLERVCPDDKVGSYLGRKDFINSECGFVGYNLKKGAGVFLDRFREIYTSGEIYSHLEWHDSYIFDRVRDEGWLFFNISEGVSGMHVWDDTPLGLTMKHLKGPLRKKGKTADVPPEYWSEKERAL